MPQGNHQNFIATVASKSQEALQSPYISQKFKNEILFLQKNMLENESTAYQLDYLSGGALRYHGYMENYTDPKSKILHFGQQERVRNPQMRLVVVEQLDKLLALLRQRTERPCATDQMEFAIKSIRQLAAELGWAKDEALPDSDYVRLSLFVKIAYNAIEAFDMNHPVEKLLSHLAELEACHADIAEQSETLGAGDQGLYDAGTALAVVGSIAAIAGMLAIISMTVLTLLAPMTILVLASSAMLLGGATLATGVWMHAAGEERGFAKAATGFFNAFKMHDEFREFKATHYQLTH